MGNEEREKLKEMLKTIQGNPEMIITNQYLSVDEWIRYNPKKRRFEYEDGVCLGDTPDEVIDFFENLAKTVYGKWVKLAIWSFK